MIELYPWQTEAYEEIKNGESGIIVASTGSGKTILGMKLIEDNPYKKVLIVVPTIVLMNQWKEELIKFKIVDENNMSFIGGGHKDIPTTRVTIAVVNSLRKVEWNHPLAKFDIATLDEIHRYAAPKNLSFLQEGTFGQTMGLTATLERADGAERILKSIIGPVLYELTPAQAKAAGYVANYDVESIACRFNEKEFYRYYDIDQEIKQYMQIFNNNYMTAMNIVQSGRKHTQYQPAVKLIRLVQARKKLFTDVERKRARAIKLVLEYKDNKILLFDELQESANKIYLKLEELGLKVSLYHSGMNKKDREQSIKDFKDNETNILVSVRALDEGLDVKEADIGIIVNGNSQKRQILQRLGRILRKKDGKIAKLYMLFVPNTQDEKYLRSRLQHLGTSDNITVINPIPKTPPIPFP